MKQCQYKIKLTSHCVLTKGNCEGKKKRGAGGGGGEDGEIAKNSQNVMNFQQESGIPDKVVTTAKNV